MYQAVITELGEARLQEPGVTPTHHALAAMASPLLEASHPRALFDAFCLRLGERFGTPQSIDACRILWRRLCNDRVIAIRGSLQADAGCAFSIHDATEERHGTRWGSRQVGDDARESLTRPFAVRSDPEPANLPEIPLIPRRVTKFVRDALTRFVRIAVGT